MSREAPDPMEVPVPGSDSHDERQSGFASDRPPGFSPLRREDDDEEVALFRRWLREQRQGRASGRMRRREDEDDEDGDSSFRTNAGPPPAWDGTSTPFEDYLIRAKLWVSTTKARPRTRGPLLLKALADTPFQDFKHLAKDVAWLQDPTNADILLDKMNTPEYYGDDQEEHLLASLARVTYHMKRQRQESARQFLARWEAAERKVAEHKVNLPSIYKGFLLINALQLTDNDIKALLNYTHGSIEPLEVKKWLRKNEAKLQASHLGSESSTATRTKSTSGIHLMEPPEETENPKEDEELQEMEHYLADLVEDQAQDFDDELGVFEENEAAEILAMMVKERKKTYMQSAQIKKDKELSRGYGQRPLRGTGQGPIRPGMYKMSITELKQRTRCRRCGKIGHWKKECTNPPSASNEATAHSAHLLELEIEDDDDVMFCHFLEETIPPATSTTFDPEGVFDSADSLEPKGYGKGEPSSCTSEPTDERAYMSRRSNDVMFSEEQYVSDDDAYATIDTGCQRTAVGIETLNRMKRHWPEALKWFKQSERNRFRSVHGISETSYNAVIPCSLGQKGCYLKPAVFEGEHSRTAPFLISLKFLRHCKAVIHLELEEPCLYLSGTGVKVPIRFGPSGALRIPLNSFTPRMLLHLRQAEGRIQDSLSNEFEVLNLHATSAAPALQADHRRSPGQRDPRGHDSFAEQAGTGRRGGAEDLVDRQVVDQNGHQAVAHRATGASADPKLLSTVGGASLRGRARTVGRTPPASLHGAPLGNHHDDPEAARGPVPELPGHERQPRPKRTDKEPTNDTDVGLGSTINTQDGMAGTTDSEGVLADATQRIELVQRVTDTTDTRRKPSSPSTKPADRVGGQLRCGKPGGLRDGQLPGGGEPADREPPGQEPARERTTPRSGDLVRPDPQVPLRPDSGRGGHPQAERELPQDVLAMSQPAGQGSVSVLPVDGGATADSRPLQGPPRHGAAHGESLLTSRTSVSHGAASMRSSVQGEVGLQPLCRSRAMPDLLQGDQVCPEAAASDTDKDRLDDSITSRDADGGRGLCRVPGMAARTAAMNDIIEEQGADLSRRKRRQIREALRKTERRWHDLFGIICTEELLRDPKGQLVLRALQPKEEKQGQHHQLQRLTGLPIHECRYLVRPPRETPRTTGCICLVKAENLKGPPESELEHLKRWKPDLGVVWQGGSEVCVCQDIAQFCQKLQVSCMLAEPNRPAPGKESHAHHRKQNGDEALYVTRVVSKDLTAAMAAARQFLSITLGIAIAKVYQFDYREQAYETLNLSRSLSQELRALQQGRHEVLHNEHESGGDVRAEQDRPPGPDEEREQAPGDEDPDQGVPRPDPDEGREQAPGEEDPDRTKMLKALVRRAHNGLGHPHKDRFCRILKAAKAGDEIIKIAQEMECSVCRRFDETRPQRRAAPPKEYGVNEIVGLDTLWLPTNEGTEKKLALNIIDLSSHFQMIIPIRSANPEAAWLAYQQWTRVFGPPRQLYIDQGPEFKGVFRSRATQEGTHVEPSSLESPFQRGVTERHGKTFKVILAKALAEKPCTTNEQWKMMVDTAIMVKNRMTNRGGYSPVQRVLGYLPRLPGGLLSSDTVDLEASHPTLVGDRKMIEAMEMRKAAAKGFFEADCDQALRNVLHAGPRPQAEYEAGQMVYFYRIGHSKKGRKLPDLWCGPARIIMTDLPSTLWLSYQEASSRLRRKGFDQQARRKD